GALSSAAPRLSPPNTSLWRPVRRRGRRRRPRRILVLVLVFARVPPVGRIGRRRAGRGLDVLPLVAGGPAIRRRRPVVAAIRRASAIVPALIAVVAAVQRLAVRIAEAALRDAPRGADSLNELRVLQRCPLVTGEGRYLAESLARDIHSDRPV